MPDNVLNAMRGLTEYLMKENQLLDQKRKEEKINLASERIADAYSRLGPNASIQDIQNLQFNAMEDAAALGTIQEVMPLINQMNQSTLAMYQVRKGEQTSNAVRQQVEQWTGQKFAPGIGGKEAVDLTQLARTLNPPENYVDNTGKTYMRKFNPDGSVKSETLVNAYGAEEQFQMFKRQEDIKFQHDIALTNLRGTWSVRTASAGVGLGGTLDLSGAKLMKGYEGENGEILYTDAKGRGVYSLQSDNTLLFYHGQAKKIDEETTKEKFSTLNEARKYYSKDEINTFKTILDTLGDTKFKELTGLDKLDVDSQGNPSEGNIDALYKVLNRGDWQSIVKGVVDKTKGSKQPKVDATGTPVRDSSGRIKVQGDDLWDAFKDFKRVGYNRRQEENKILGHQNSTKVTGPTLPRGITQQEWNIGSKTLQDVFQSTSNPKIKSALQNWIAQRMGNGTLPNTIDFNSISQLPIETQGELIKLINKYIK